MKKVQVLMSTYNGGTNIVKQVNTILDQKGVNVYLTIRDDGSEHSTLLILKKLDEKYQNVEIHYGKNIGYRKSFLSLLNMVKKDIDYCAFSDQDDIWKENKLVEAVKILDENDNKNKLYISSLDIYNEKGLFLNKHDISRVPNNIYSLFSRNRFAGCTFVFSKELALLSNEYANLEMLYYEAPDHDFFLAAIGYCFGFVYLDHNSYIEHIRYENSVTSGGNGIFKRLKVEYKIVFFMRNTRLNFAKTILVHEKDRRKLKPEVSDYFKIVVNYKKSLYSKLKLIRLINCGSVLCNMESIIKVIIGNF